MAIEGVCTQQDCTIIETNVCLEGHPQRVNCHFFKVTSNTSVTELPEANATNLSQPVAARQFHSGHELGSSDVTSLMMKNYTYLIGVLGSTDAGKTCLLSSLYLLASQGELLPEVQFASSLTLQGFEERVRLLRKWGEGVLPDKFSEHTILQDPRSPAFMHIGLHEVKNQITSDLLITDLPGEWTDNMIDQASTSSRLNFLQRADAILYVIDGPKLADPATQHKEIYRAESALGRLVETIQIDLAMPIILVVSKSDVIEMKSPLGLARIISTAKGLGLTTVTHVLAAAFSRQPKLCKSGTGIFDAFGFALNHTAVPPTPLNHRPLLERSFWRA